MIGRGSPTALSLNLHFALLTLHHQVHNNEYAWPWTRSTEERLILNQVHACRMETSRHENRPTRRITSAGVSTPRAPRIKSQSQSEPGTNISKKTQPLQGPIFLCSTMAGFCYTILQAENEHTPRTQDGIGFRLQAAFADINREGRNQSMSIEESINETEEALIKSLSSKRSAIDDRTGKGSATEMVVDRELLVPHLAPGMRCSKGAVVAATDPAKQSPAIDRIIYDPSPASPLLS